jgi:hypothetical protein
MRTPPSGRVPVPAIRNRTRPALRSTLRTRMALLYAALICASGIALAGITEGVGQAVAPALFIHRRHVFVPSQPGAIHAGHPSGTLIPFIGSDLFWTDVVAVTITFRAAR